MGLLQTMNSLLRQQAEAVGPFLHFDEAGFGCAGESPWRAAWSDVKRITGYKIDRLAVDEIRVDLALQHGITRIITEECPGFEGLMLELARRFPTVSGWLGRIVQPPFAPNAFVLYERGD